MLLINFSHPITAAQHAQLAYLTGQPIEDTLACSAEHVLHRCDYRPRPEACPTCFITRIRRRMRAASISIRPAHRYTLNS